MVGDVVFIMHYTIYPRRGGIHEQVYLLARELNKLGVKIHLAYNIHGLLTSNSKLRLPLALSGLNPKLWHHVERHHHAIIETAWPGLASLFLRLEGKENCYLHLHSIESDPDYGLPVFQRYTVKILEQIAGCFCKKIISVSLKEYEILKRRFGSKVAYVPVAVDVENHDKYVDKKSFYRSIIGIPQDKLVVAFVGGMKYKPNLESARVIAYQIMPKVYKKLGEKVLFMIIGSDPPPELRKLKNLMITGYVDEISPYIAASDLCIAPVYKGGGVKMKILDCMALKKPVVATAKAVEGTMLKPWKHYIPADKIEEFIEEIVKFALLKDKGEYDRLGEEAYRYVKEEHSASMVAKKFLRVIEND